MSFIALLLVAAAAVSGLVIIYSRRDWTLPGYEGKGGVGTFIGFAAGGVVGVWLVMGVLVARVGNVFAVSDTAFQFATRYEAPGSSLLMMMAWVVLSGVLAMAIVAGANVYRHGRAFMK